MRLKRFKLRDQYSFRVLERLRDTLGIERQYNKDYHKDKYEKGKLIKNPKLEERKPRKESKVKKEFSKPMKFFKQHKVVPFENKLENLKNKYNKET